MFEAYEFAKTYFKNVCDKAEMYYKGADKEFFSSLKKFLLEDDEIFKKDIRDLNLRAFANTSECQKLDEGLAKDLKIACDGSNNPTFTKDVMETGAFDDEGLLPCYC